MAVFYGRAGRLPAQNGGFRRGQWGFVVSLPVTIANAAAPEAHLALGAADYAGVALWLAGWLMEAAADRAKLAAYHSVPRKAYHELGGMWCWCRHPNFAGETLCWLGVALAASNVV
jgi:steroid 5-alpha reductase family enzyme